MNRSVWMRALSVALTTWLAGCTGTASQAASPNGSVGLNLTVGDTDVVRIDYAVLDGDATIRSSSIEVGALGGTTVRATVGQIPVGGPFTLNLTAFDRSGEPVCSGSAMFSMPRGGVRVGVSVVLNCEVVGPGLGEVDIDVGLQTCPVVVDALTVAPNLIPVGAEALVEATVIGADSVIWSAAAGTFADPTIASTAYTCTTSGTQTLSLVATGAYLGSAGTCTRSLSAEIECISGDDGGLGTDGGMDSPDPDGEGVLTLLHNNDGESSILPLSNSIVIDGVTTEIPVAGMPAFRAVKVREENAAILEGSDSVLSVYAGDAFLASATLSCSLPPNPPTEPIDDAAALALMDYDAFVLGNHEFDFGPDFLERFIRTFGQPLGQGPQRFLSANLDFSAEPGFSDLIDIDGLLAQGSVSPAVGRSAIVANGTARFGVVGATTPLLPTISSPRGVTVTPDLTSTALAVQGEIDRLLALGVRKIIFVSHLQDIDNDRALISLLRGVDIAVAGGGDELLLSDTVAQAEQLLPGETAPVAGTYPLEVTDADGRPVYVVTTAGNYKYLGRLDVRFDASGEVAEILPTSYPRRVVPESSAAAALGIIDAEAPATDVGTIASSVEACLAALSEPLVGTEVVLDTSRNSVRGRETNTGNTVTDAYLAAYDDAAPSLGLPPRGPSNQVIAVQNGGGIRQNAGDQLPNDGVVPGTISRVDTRNVLAFTNFVTIVSEVTPSDLKEIFERSVSSIGGGQFLQVAGLSVVASLSGTAQVIASDGTVTTPGSRVVSITLDDGTPIVAAGVVVAGAPNVRLVTNSFTADGGDNYPWLGSNPNKTQLFDSDGVAATYESAWTDFLLSLAPGFMGLPTIPAIAAYAPGGEGRIVLNP